jgi:hypothetical protein
MVGRELIHFAGIEHAQPVIGRALGIHHAGRVCRVRQGGATAAPRA